jgi:ribose-phosphate pyrophosphokinase
MRYLYLQEDFKPTLGLPQFREKCLPVEVFTFKGGEEHVKLDSSKITYDLDEVTIVSRINSSSDLFRVILANDALIRMGAKDIYLYMPYLPYARQDRVMVSGEPLSIKVFADHLNLCGFKKVFMIDPHSDVGPAVINNAHPISNHSYVEKVLGDISYGEFEGEDFVIIAPDAGADKKIGKTCEAIGWEGEIITALKKRNLETREIEKLVFNGDVKGKSCIIIDDICDGGRTFATLATQLKEEGAKYVYLIVTHGIFSYGEDQLKSIDHIWSTNSWREYDSELVTFVKL